MHVIATAGHVDHGKSTLVLALTGTDPDRLAEEKERGLTIDLGFAALALPSGKRMAIVDVPGHERFVRNMLAGVGTVDACIFVVAGTEGWMPQSEEHLRILQLLGVKHGLVALTKVGLLDDDLLELALLDVEEHVEGTFLEGCEVIEVDALDGTGISDLKAALDRLIETTPTAADVGRPRLWIDRAFAAKGAGTVVTGTLTGGRIRVDDELLVAPAEHEVRIRALQNHNEERTKIGPGNRVAVNLGGVSHDQVARGDVLVRASEWHRTAIVDASLQVLDSLDHEVSRRGAHLAYIGSGEHPCKMRILGPDTLAPGAQGFVRLYLDTPLPLLPGDRFVLRESGRAETIGGGEILDIDPQTTASKAAPDRSVERVIAERGWVDVDQLRLLTGEKRSPDAGRWVVDPAVLESTKKQLGEAVAGAGGLGLDIAQLTEQERAALELVDGIVIDGSHAKPADQVDTLGDHPIIAALAATPFSPPAPEGIERDELRELVRRGALIESEGIFFAADAVEQAAAIIAGLLAETPAGVTVAEVREALGTSRKYAMPLLARFDSTGVTRRRDDLRIAGPRLPDIT